MTDDTTRIQFHEGSLLLPPGFEDRTTNLFVPADTAKQPNLSVARDWLNEDETLSAYIDRQLGQLRKRMPGHKLLNREPEQLGAGEAALTGERIDASYRNGDRTVHQRQAAFIVAPRRALILTASSPRPFDEAFETLWRDWLDGYQQPSDSTDESVQL
nr:hypothetical protein HUO10_006519 [Paraburkholderia busanensis]